MKKFKGKLIVSTFMVLIFSILMCQNVTLAENSVTSNIFSKVEYSEEYKRWLELPEEERENTLVPRMYDIPANDTKSTNPLYRARLMMASLDTSYNLKNVIPNNLIIKDQKETNSCWAFATLSSLETNLALSNYKNNVNSQKVYDYSERHMEYATSNVFANDVINTKGYNRKVGGAGNNYLAESYLTNGTGAIPEDEMPFENNEDIIDISQIQNKTVSTEVYDTVFFANYQKQTGSAKEETMQKIKKHIQDCGAIYSGIHSNIGDTASYNKDTGALYCNDSTTYVANHAISIIGWDDNYSIDNFSEKSQPSSNGAWIIRNSYGERKEYKLDELKQQIYEANTTACNNVGWTDASLIPNSYIESIGLTIEGNIAYIKMGNNGIMYVSYEDCNIANYLYGIEKANDTVTYDHIYQYDEYYPTEPLGLTISKIMLANVFEKQTTGTEYLTRVALNTPETYTCKVYVNPNGSSLNASDLQEVTLKAGDSETVSAGYHTLEFANEVELKSDCYAVVIAIQGSRSNGIYVSLEAPSESDDWYNVGETQSGKCFFAVGNNLNTNNTWFDLSKLSEQAASLPDGDSTIKAFTTDTSTNPKEETKDTQTETDKKQEETKDTQTETDKKQEETKDTQTETDKKQEETKDTQTETDKKQEETKDTQTETDKKQEETKNTQTETDKKQEETKDTQTETDKKQEETKTTPTESNKKQNETQTTQTESNKKQDGTQTTTTESNKKQDKTQTTTTESNKKQDKTQTTTTESNKKQEETAKNSNFSNAKCKLVTLKVDYSTNNEGYTIMKVQITGITRALSNDSVKYYYYLSQNKNEKNIKDWIEASEVKIENDKITFLVNSKNLENYNNLTSDENLYIYIKEVATKGSNTAELISSPLQLDIGTDTAVSIINAENQKNKSAEVNTQNTIDNQNTVDNNTNKQDNTVAKGKLPQTGVNITIALLAIAIISIGIMCFVKYKNLKRYIK